MAKKSLPPIWLAELQKHVAAQREVERKQVFDKWNELLGGKPPPTKRVLRAHCEVLIDKPHLIEGPYAPYIFRILQDWFAKTPPPKRPRTAKQIADLVDWVIEFPEKIPPSIARKQVADAFGMSVAAVKKDHLRFGKPKRDKSQ